MRRISFSKRTHRRQSDCWFRRLRHIRGLSDYLCCSDNNYGETTVSEFSWNGVVFGRGVRKYIEAEIQS